MIPGLCLTLVTLSRPNANPVLLTPQLDLRPALSQQTCLCIWILNHPWVPSPGPLSLPHSPFVPSRTAPACLKQPACETTCLFCSLTVFIIIKTFRECRISQLRCIFQAKCPLSPEDEWPALCLPPTFLLLFPAITSFCHTSSAASLAFSLNSLMLSKEIHKFVQRRGSYLPIWMCKGGRRRREWTLAFWWQWSTTLAALQQQLLLQFPYFIAIFSSLTAWGYHLILNLATPHLPL